MIITSNFSVVCASESVWLKMTSHGAFIRTAVGFIYPAYKSLQAIMSEEQEDDMTWLRYWVVLAVVSLIEIIVDPLFDFLPGYLLGKCVFLVWCMLPTENSGGNLIFTQVLFQICFYNYVYYDLILFRCYSLSSKNIIKKLSNRHQ